MMPIKILDALCMEKIRVSWVLLEASKAKKIKKSDFFIFSIAQLWVKFTTINSN